MSVFRYLFPCGGAEATPVLPPLPVLPPHMGAGCVFTDGKHIVAGYQPEKKKPGITGIGGHREGEETYLETAYRETIEEIFHVTKEAIPVSLLPSLLQNLHPRMVKMKKGYVLVVFSFEDLAVFLKLCQTSGLRSPLYTKMPKTLIEMIQSRQIDLKAEISILCLLPVVKHEGRMKHFVNPAFVDDLRLYQ